MRPSRRLTRKGRQAFDYETQILLRLNHPAIPKLYEKFEFKGNYFFAMEYMEGKNLEELIFDEEMKFDERQSLQLVSQLLNIIGYLHHLNLVHRDIRIPNVIVKDHEVKLIDFGLARYMGDDQKEQEVSDYFIEKRLRREIHYKSDFYSLGHFLLFLLYSTYQEEGGESGSWETELRIQPLTKALLRRMLQIEEPFQDHYELKENLIQALMAIQSH